MSCSTLDLSSSPSFQAIFSDDVRKLQDIFKRSGHEIRYVVGSPIKYYFSIILLASLHRLAGGPARDILGGKEPNDLDFATTATPEVFLNSN